MEFIRDLSELPCWPYLIPPVAGAIIGYFTNYLAIRMLFRPLTKKYFLKISLPLTPGIIPARRQDLARRIGDMVGDHILTREVILEKLQSPAFDDALYSWVAARFNFIITQDFGPGLSLLPDKSMALWQSWWGRGWRQTYTVVDYVVERPDLKLFLHTPITEFSRRLLSADINTLLPEELRSELKLKLPQLLKAGLHSSSLANWLGNEIDRVTQGFVTSGKPLGEILPAELQTAFMQEIHRELPDLLIRFSRLLYDPEIRDSLKLRLHQGINVYIENMGFWRRLVTSLAMSDEEIKEKIDKLVDDVAQDFAVSLQQPRWQEKVFNLLSERMAAFLEMSPASLAGRLSFVRVNRGLELLKCGLLKQVKSVALSKRLAQMLEEFAEPLLSKPLSAILDYLGVAKAETRLVEAISDRILRTLRSNQIKRRLAVIAASRFEQWFANYPIGRLSRFLPATLHESIIDLFYQMSRRRLVEELPRLSERFEIKDVVEERVNKLPIIQVEELLLSVMREHFTYINIFGALVGFLIGGVQVLIFWGLNR